MQSFKKGDYVTCVHTDFVTVGSHGLERGELYQIESIHESGWIGVYGMYNPKFLPGKRNYYYPLDYFKLDEFRSSLYHAGNPEGALKPCAHCGGKARVQSGNGVTIISCSNVTGREKCLVHPRVYSMVTREEPDKNTLNEASELWNRRS